MEPVVLRGDCRIDQAEALLAALRALHQAAPDAPARIDARDADSVDTAVLQVLAVFFQRLHPDGAVTASPAVAARIRALGLASLIPYQEVS